MSEPIAPPGKKNPQRRTDVPQTPPQQRSRAALGLAAAAAEGRFMLQVCGDCGAVQYPPRDACSRCLSINLQWQDVSPGGRLVAETRVRATTDLYFRKQMPVRVGTVKLDVGPSVICHVHGDVGDGADVRMAIKLDRAGQGVMMALPVKETPFMEDDPRLREMSCTPRHRRVLVTDARNPNAPAIVSALAAAGAEKIFVGLSEDWRPNRHNDDIMAVPGVEMLPLDVTDSKSVEELAAELGGKTDILVNNARYVRPGGLMARNDTVFAQNEMDVNYLGLMRLAQAFGPAMCARTADGTNAAVAWVNILSAYAISNSPDYGCFSASNAAALSLSQNMRADFRTSGLRVLNVFVGPTDDDWHQELPPPKVPANTLARSLVQGLVDGLEDVYCGDVAKDMIERFRASPKIQEREMTGFRS
ncbi:SDR family NAD(P)-dependent oxidoreductase [Roseibium sp. MMSF_3412]|uniref:SDR family NAD(P)-dependent oxidoreductase n=1 Tax=Roseibium sp. MMSF_3412 TaxID=3046712 RepID=UPI00273EC4E8|nr:SDR family NAD(P)-dependent oxidoreductase [Roseibium sp. MMSF_3412]